MRLSAPASTRLAAVLLLPVLAACGTEDGDDVARDVTPSASSGASAPTAVPAARGPVTTAHLATVMDEGRPELCLGPMAESWPPQCSGLPLAGWRWADHPQHEQQGRGSDRVRWGSFAVTGTWDGETFTVDEAIPAALYDVPPDASPVRPTPTATPAPAELDRVVAEVAELPGPLAAHADGGQVLVDVVYDDGTLQEYADHRWGDGVVVLLPLLRGAGAS